MTSIGNLPLAEEAVLSSNIFPAGMIMPWAGSSEFGATGAAGWILCDGRTLDSVANPKYAALYSIITTIYGGSGPSAFNIPDLRGRALLGADNMGTTPGAANRVSPAARGNSGGAQNVALATAQLPPHSHGGSTDNSGSLSHTHTGTSEVPDRSMAHSHGIDYGAIVTAGNAYTGAYNNNSTTFGWTIFLDQQSIGKVTATQNGGNDGASHRHAFTTNAISSTLVHNHTITTNNGTATGSAGNGTGSAASHENMPPFLVCNYLIKF